MDGVRRERVHSCEKEGEESRGEQGRAEGEEVSTRVKAASCISLENSNLEDDFKSEIGKLKASYFCLVGPFNLLSEICFLFVQEK